jgi:SagB-type dehydrogenase family enzyme
MPNDRYQPYRFFLKDTIRQQVDFSQTDQHHGLPPPPRQAPCPPDAVRIDLPDGSAALARLAQMPVGEAIASRKSVRRYDATPLTLEELAALLWAAQGVRRVLNPAVTFRTVPSAGARHSFETYLAIDRVETLPPGLYRYLPFDGQLARLAIDREIRRRAAAAALNQRFISLAAVTFFWTTIPARMEWRYGVAGHKVIALDAGHVCQNLYLACQSLGLGTCAIGAYDQEACDRLLGVDGDEEFTVYLAPVGRRRAAASP